MTGSAVIAARRLVMLTSGVVFALGVLCPRPALAQTTQVVEYYHTDALGSVRAVTRAGVVVSRHDYLPFGEELAAQIPPPDKRLFTAKERDSETATDYFEARYLRTEHGRFTALDPAELRNDTDPQTWNRYVYCRNNPMRLVDPDGREFRISGDLLKDPAGINYLIDMFVQLASTPDGFARLEYLAGLPQIISIDKRTMASPGAKPGDIRQDYGAWGECAQGQPCAVQLFFDIDALRGLLEANDPRYYGGVVSLGHEIYHLTTFFTLGGLAARNQDYLNGKYSLSGNPAEDYGRSVRDQTAIILQALNGDRKALEALRDQAFDLYMLQRQVWQWLHVSGYQTKNKKKAGTAGSSPPRPSV